MAAGALSLIFINNNINFNLYSVLNHNDVRLYSAELANKAS